MKIFYSERLLEHEQGPDHPECPERLRVIKNELKRGYEWHEPKELDEKELLLVHSREFIGKLKINSAHSLSFPDNRFSKNTFEIAKLAAAGAVGAAKAAESGFAFALVRPPGHHAGRDSFGGFCYLNNIAIGIRTTGKKALIIDIDAHHGNGTQEIFYEDKSVFYLSLHQHPSTCYPGTGYKRENNEHILNVPLPPGTDDEEYLEAFNRAIDQAIKFKPEIVGISAGFDTFYLDRLTSFGIRKSRTYYEIARIIQENFEQPKFAVLEGGYYLPKLGENCESFIRGFR